MCQELFSLFVSLPAPGVLTKSVCWTVSQRVAVDPCGGVVPGAIVPGGHDSFALPKMAMAPLSSVWKAVVNGSTSWPDATLATTGTSTTMAVIIKTASATAAGFRHHCRASTSTR